MITSFKIFEELNDDIQLEVENSIPPLIDLLIDDLSFIIHKQKRKYLSLRPESITGYFNKKKVKSKDQYFETILKIKMLSKPKRIEDVIDAGVVFRSNTEEKEYTFTIKINDKIVYDFISDEETDYNKRLIELAVREYKKFLKITYTVK